MLVHTIRLWSFGLVVCALALASSPGHAAAPTVQTIQIGFLGETPPVIDLPEFLDPPPRDDGAAGARVAAADNNTTGRFVGQSFVLTETILPRDGDAVEAARAMLASGIRLIVANLSADALMKVAALPEAKDATIFNAGAYDDELRGAQCRRNVLHTMPSYAMLADGLMQYLMAMRWREIMLVAGPTPGDKRYADAIRASAKKFQMKIIADKPWTFAPGARRTDTGHFDIKGEVQRFTQGIDYDILIVADDAFEFGDTLSYRAMLPRPVAGTQGLVPSGWARPHEQWGATQMQQRFLKAMKRWMTERDFAAWLAVRSVGEAALRLKSADAAAIADYIRSDAFEIGAYKGARLSFRNWDGQMRQPILLTDARSLVSVSPQAGFLHQFSELDTLGADRPETKCKFN